MELDDPCCLFGRVHAAYQCLALKAVYQIIFLPLTLPATLSPCNVWSFVHAVLPTSSFLTFFLEGTSSLFFCPNSSTSSPHTPPSSFGYIPWPFPIFSFSNQLVLNFTLGFVCNIAFGDVFRGGFILFLFLILHFSSTSSFGSIPWPSSFFSFSTLSAIFPSIPTFMVALTRPGT